MRRGWPPARVRPTAWYLHVDGGLRPEALPSARRQASTPTTRPWGSARWDGTRGRTALDPTIGWDQSGDDARPSTFTSAPFDAPLEVLGSAVAVLEVAALQARFASRRSWPTWRRADGRRWSPRGGFDLELRESPTRRVAVEPGARYRVTVPLRATAYRVPAGHRLRLSIACADFPRIWPTPRPATLTLFHGASHVVVPVAPNQTPALVPPAWGRSSRSTCMGRRTWAGGSDGKRATIWAPTR